MKKVVELPKAVKMENLRLAFPEGTKVASKFHADAKNGWFMSFSEATGFVYFSPQAPNVPKNRRMSFCLDTNSSTFKDTFEKVGQFEVIQIHEEVMTNEYGDDEWAAVQY